MILYTRNTVFFFSSCKLCLNGEALYLPSDRGLSHRTKVLEYRYRSAISLSHSNNGSPPFVQD